MCIERLICKEKIACNLIGITDDEIVLSAVGFVTAPIQYLAVLVKANGEYTIEVHNNATAEVVLTTGRGSGIPEFCIIRGLSMASPDIYTLKCKSPTPMSVHEINMATQCLCDPDECQPTAPVVDPEQSHTT